MCSGNFNNIFCNELFVTFLMQKLLTQKLSRNRYTLIKMGTFKNGEIGGDVGMAPPWSCELKVIPIIFVIMSTSVYFYEGNAGLMKEQISAKKL
ncbi:hypothetical protein BscR1v2_015240 [Bartonella schoenbuchensis R1]|uniref:Uncharacterized protein n=3 Tax=Bartonella schoenbuchensis TaxID=165694 RepID=A0A1S6XS51_BARSR|nr:hypothetical protein BscR1v2_015240 [Bartonella schoenbuchensis R1]